MVVPAVGVVVGDDDGGLGQSAPLERVDLVDDELLLVDRVRVRRVPVLVAGRLEVAHRRQGAGGSVAVWIAETSWLNQ